MASWSKEEIKISDSAKVRALVPFVHHEKLICFK